MMQPETTRRVGKWSVLVEVLLTFAVFAAFAARPVPDSNEAHYLAKAKHNWDATWCASDFFLQSADVHQAFYWSIGWLTKFFPLMTVAWIGRCIGWLCLAIGWQRLHTAVGGPRSLAWLTAIVLALLSDNLQMANEWFIGGIEAKVFAWAAIFLAAAAVAENRWTPVFVWLGVATAFHIVVGGWVTLLAALAWWWNKADRPPLRTLWPGFAVWAVLAGPFLWRGLELSAGAPSETTTAAYQIHVYERLHHHLNPLKFAWPGVIRHGIGWLVFLVGCWWCAPTAAERRVRSLVFGAGILAALGIVIAATLQNSPEWSARVLRFYWFRSSDVLLPVGLALLAPQLLGWVKWPAVLRGAACVGAGLAAVVMVWQNVNLISPRGDKFTYDVADWRAVGRWVQENTRPTAVFLTPAATGTFKFYAERGEVATWKDVPQDAPRVVEWWQRMQTIHAADKERKPPEPSVGRWRLSLGTLGSARLRQLATQFGADYIVVVKLKEVPPLELPLVYENGHYAIYAAEAVAAKP